MKGQALVEYLLLFSMLALISVSIVKSMHEYIGETVEALNYTLQEQLTVGVCDRECFFYGFRN
jgi:hypothetical protein